MGLHHHGPVASWVLGPGYALEWANGPPPQRRQPNRPLREEAYVTFADENVVSLVASGAISEVPRDYPWLTSPISVIPKAYSDKLRLILDMRFLNEFLADFPFVYEHLAMLADLVQPGDYAFSVDITDAYHHVEIHPAYRKFLGFQWRDKFYVFNVLPFGMKTSCWVFTRVMGVLASFWRTQGLRLISYLDDAGFFVRPQLWEQTVRVVLQTYETAGFLVQRQKLVGTDAPTTRLEFLGFVVDTRLMRLEVTDKRWVAFQEVIATLLRHRRRVAIRKLARFAGMAVSMKLAVGKLASAFTVYTYRHIAVHTDEQGLDLGWHTHTRLASDDGVLAELKFWSSVTRDQFTAPIRRPSVKPALTLFTDASDIGWGGHDEDGWEAQGFLTMSERAASSTLRELRGVLYTLQAYAAKGIARGTTVLLYTDSQNTERILNKGGVANAANHPTAMEIFRLELKLGFALEVVWIPREENERADFLSKVTDRDDWMLNKALFAALDGLWGPHSVDAFGSHANNVLPVFFSRRWCPGTAGVDAFAQPVRLWRGNPWVNPPFRLIGRVVRHLRECSASATVVVPHWPRQHWWSVVCPDGAHFARFIVGWRCMRRLASTVGVQERDMFLPGWASANEEGRRPPSYRIFACRVSFAANASPLDYRQRCLAGGCNLCLC